MIEEGIRTRLLSQTAVTDLCGQRVYYAQLPQIPTYPCISYHLISENSEHAMGSDTGVIRARVQVDCWANGSAAQTVARNLDVAVRNALSRFRGTVSGSWGSVVIQDIFRQVVRDEYEQDTRIWHRSRDFEVIYQE